MARGRMINNKIAADKAVNDLSCDTSRLAFTWLITFADAEGRTYGDPAMVCSMLFPRRRDVTPEQMESYISEWADAGLVQWYEADGDKWICFPKFEDNQRGLDRRKEPVSAIPAPPDDVPGTEEVRTEYVPDTVEEKRTEVEEKRTEGSGASAPTPPAGPETAAHVSRRSDPRSKHAAILAVRETLGGRKLPPLELYDKIISLLGPEPDVGKLKACRSEWVARGYNGNNWAWLLEWYAQGIPQRTRAAPGPPPGNGNGKHVPTDEERTEAARKLLKELRGEPDG